MQARSALFKGIVLLYQLFAVYAEFRNTLPRIELSIDDECQQDGEGQCALVALQRRGQKTSELAAESRMLCAPLSAPENAVCKHVVEWAAGGGKNDPQAATWFKDIVSITGVTFQAANLGDYHRLYYCSPPGGKQCGSPPCSCSKPPCDQCFQDDGASKRPSQPQIVASGNGTSTVAVADISSAPPPTALAYNGKTWPTMTFPGTEVMHIFAIGDWGGMDGSLNPIEGRPNLVAYDGGAKSGPSVFPRNRWDKMHVEELCSHKELVQCFNTKGYDCPAACGYVPGVDDQAQLLVAKAFKERAAISNPQFVMNVGDNFYWGGIEKTCGTPMTELSYTAHHQFSQIYEGIYNGPGLDGKLWISVLGNHDWGGRVFNNGWDQQIAYTWKSSRWVLPAAYYSTKAIFPDQGFSIDLFMIDSNAMDADDPEVDPEHNVCGEKHNPTTADCSSQGGPASVATCKKWFWDLWDEQHPWLEQKLSESKADWQFVITHFPCGHQEDWYKKLHTQFGLDLLVTGHRHDQELWDPSLLGGLTCFVTGGGGGITSEATPDEQNQTAWYGEAQYGFYDLTVSKTAINISSIHYNGTVLKSAMVYPTSAR